MHIFRTWACIVICLLSGCSGVERMQESLREMHARGMYVEAAKLLESPAAEEAYGSKDWLLLRLERGAAELAAGDPERALRSLDEAEEVTAYNYTPRDGDALAQWTLNESAAPYMAQPYEDMYVNVLKQLAHLQLGTENGAFGESARLLDKATNLGRITEQYLRALKSGENGKFVSKYSPDSRYSTERVGDYIASPLGSYLAALVFAKAADPGRQQAAAARLRQSLGEQQAHVGRVDTAAFQNMEAVTADSFNVVAVAFSGRGPIKESRTVTLSNMPGVPITIPFPTLVRLPSRVASVRLEQQSAAEGSAEGTSAVESVELSLVEDLGCVVAENYRRTEPLIYTRTVIRIGIKAGLVAGATYGVSASSGRRNQEWAVLTALAGAAAIYFSESADLRSWTMLPGQARVAALKLPAGEHFVRAVYRMTDGSVAHTEWQRIPVTEDGLTPVVSFDPN
jgi:hypothetical protein